MLHLLSIHFIQVFSRRRLANHNPSQLHGILSPGSPLDKDSMFIVAVSLIQGTNDPVLLLFIPKKLL